MSHEPEPPPPPHKMKEEEEERELEEEGEWRQENGTRRWGPPRDWQGPPPPRGSEVFVGKLPRDLLEDELVPAFAKAGRIYEARIMMEQGRLNRGYAFVLYASPAEARRAIDQLDNAEIRKGRCIGVCESVDNCRLFVGGIPKTKTKEDILEEMRKVSEGVVSVILYSSVADKSKNRGFAFVEYESHRRAAAARRRLLPGRGPLFGHDVAVDWAEPEPRVHPDTMAKVTILYVRNLMASTSEEAIRQAFSLHDQLQVDKVKKLRDFAFVHYRTRDHAQQAMDRLHETELDGSTVEVTWAKPVDRFSRQRPCRPFLYPAAAYEPPPYHVAPPFGAGRGGGGLVRLGAVRGGGRGRGAAGMRRCRNFVPFKSQEVAYPFAASKLGRIPEEGKPPYAPHEYMYILNPAAHPEGLEALQPYGARLPAAFLHPAAGYEEVPCYTYLPAPSGSLSSY